MSLAGGGGRVTLLAAFLILAAVPGQANDSAHKLAEKFAGDTGQDAGQGKQAPTTAQQTEALRKAEIARKREAELKAQEALKEEARKRAEAVLKAEREKQRVATKKPEPPAKPHAKLPAADSPAANPQVEITPKSDEAEMLARAREEAEHMQAAALRDRNDTDARRVIEEAEQARRQLEALLAKQGPPTAPQSQEPGTPAETPAGVTRTAEVPDYTSEADAAADAAIARRVWRQTIDRIETRTRTADAEKDRARAAAIATEVERAKAAAAAAETERARVAAAEAEKERARVATEDTEKERARIAAGEAEKERARIAAAEAEKERARVAAVEAEKERARVAAAEAEIERSRVAAAEAEAEKERARIAAAEADKESARVAAVEAEKERARIAAVEADKERARVAEQSRGTATGSLANKPLEERVTVLIVMKPGNYGIRRNNKTADPVLCAHEGCFISAGSSAPAGFLPARKALGFGNTWGGRAGACRNSLGCVFRGIPVAGASLLLQPVDMHVLKHDRRQPQTIATDSKCRLQGEHLACQRGIYAEDYTLWIVPESVADAVGPDALERAVADGLNGPRSAALGLR